MLVQLVWTTDWGSQASYSSTAFFSNQGGAHYSMFPAFCPVSLERDNFGTCIHYLNLHMKKGGTVVYLKNSVSNYNPFYVTVWYD